MRLAVFVSLLVVGGWFALFEARRLLTHFGLVATLPYTQQRYLETTRRGAELVAAIRAYKAACGEYPASLDQLVPTRIAAIEPPLVGTGEWEYERPETDRFILSFFVGPLYESDWFDSAEGSWYVDR